MVQSKSNLSVFIPRESAGGRLAMVPEMVRKYRNLALDVTIERQAGRVLGIDDSAYTLAGARLLAREQGYSKADIVVHVEAPDDEISLKKGAVLILQTPSKGIKAIQDMCRKAEAYAFAMDKLPRITRAQAMDVLSSQANLAGYRGVIEAASHFRRILPLMMTAAGTIVAARILVLGAGVAGLQAIATARRLGAIVTASDIRPSVKEQVLSLGARFLDVPGGSEGQDGYAAKADKAYQKRQVKALMATLPKQDIVICTAQIPGKKAPLLITKKMLDGMQPGSVVVDLAASSGGNCYGTEAGEIIDYNGVTLVGLTDLIGRVGVDASRLYSNNVLAFLRLLLKDGRFVADFNDEIVSATCIHRPKV